ncbi:vWA domain-containing protein [Rubripirellula reticaptiva]|uniref:VWFA domain-containing protein n=1 Tax=Rubripirellula reticaptiva TaxID=2528013 RepID=A0A5C6FBR2_9BACT|nr:hypothetical protein [Rubripirellula reticaptiva]TWU58020.1 hypothetical protein Poly59_09290 [Rubripirellula reticaptiva]
MNHSAPAAQPVDLTPSPPAWPALVMSLVFHILLLTTIGLIWTQNPLGSGEITDRPVGIAIVHRMPDRDLYTEPVVPQVIEQPTSEAASAAAAASPAAPPADLSPPLDLDGILKAIQSTPSPISGTGMAGETNLDGDAFGSAGGKTTSGDSSDSTAMLFGVSGSGSRFVYVFDRSDSMNGFGGKPLRAAKAELIRSLGSLSDKQRFQLIFYNDKPTPFRMTGVPLQMMAGDDPNVMMATQYVNSITAFGGTEHESAIKMALRLSPDVIFFLTDARIPRLSSGDLREIQARAQQVGTTIHAIEFGPDPVPPIDSFLRDLASMNQGQYQYVDVRGLKSPGTQ